MTFKTLVENSIADISADKIKIYPNPANNILYIESLLSIEQIDIYDISGRKLKQLSIDNLSNGIYFIKITADKKNLFLRL